MVKYKMPTVDWTVKWNVEWLEPTTLWSELQTRAIRVDVLVPPFNNSCCIKTFTLLPWKSDKEGWRIWCAPSITFAKVWQVFAVGEA